MALGIDDVRVGVWTDRDHHTGCTVIIPPPGAVGGIAVRGGAPGTREAAILGAASPREDCHAVVLCGSSLFGLRAADGVVDWCESNGIGLRLPMGCFPIVGAAVVLDIRNADARRIDRDAGWAACVAAGVDEPPRGSVGVGAGCTVGKEAGPGWGSKGGQGIAVMRSGALVVGALVAVNALGSVIAEDGGILAGCRAPARLARYPQASFEAVSGAGASNTLIGCIVTNATLGKAAVCRVADLAHSGIARTVSPAHTSLDGDALFALATGRVTASIDLVAELAAQAVAAAVRDGVREARGVPGWPADPRAGEDRASLDWPH